MFVQLTNITSIDFKTKWTDIELAGVKAMVDIKLQDVAYDSRPTDAYHMFYTSGDGQAMLNVQGEDLTLDGGRTYVSHFTLTENHTIVAVSYDEDENTVFYGIQ